MKNITLRLFIIVFAALMIIFLTANFFGFYFGQEFRDFYTQHLNFINYIRMNFYQTHDLFPQFNMNMGLGQSMVTLYYHGLYNPFVLVSFLVPFIPTEVYFEMMIAFVIALTAASSYYLLTIHKFNHNVKLVSSILCSFSAVLIYQSHYHPMFIYYVPFAFINLILLHKLVDSKKTALFTLCLSLVFFFNFFFAPVVLVINLIYFTYLIYNKNNKLELSIKYVIVNIVAILCGFLVTLPQFIAFLNTARSGIGTAPSVYNINAALPFTMIINPYYLGIGVIGFCAMIYFLFKRENKFYFLLSSVVFIFAISDFVNYILNVGQYIHYKQLIYTLPFLSILIAAFLSEKSKLKSRLVLVTSIICIVGFVIVIPLSQLNIVKEVLALINSYTVFKLPIIACIIGIIIVSLNLAISKLDLKNISSYKTIILCVMLASCSFIMFSSFYEGRWFNNITTTTCPETEMQYVNGENTNQVECINESSPGYFTSIINQEYIDFFKGNSENSSYGNERFVYNESFNNPISEYVYGISEDSADFIYGQTNSNIYQGTTSSTIEMYFYDTAPNGVKTKEEVTPTKHIDSYMLSGDVTIPTNYTDGVAVITFEQTNDICDMPKGNMCSITINGVRNEDVTVASHQTLINHDTFTYYIDLSEANGELNITSSPGTWLLSNINIYYLSPETLAQHKTYTQIDNLEIDYNNSYSFDITMQEAGYVFTTLIYDENFIITVDGVEVTPQKVNEIFLGFEIEEGTHSVVISYEIKGFKVALLTTIIGFSTLIIIAIYERKKYG